MKLPFLTKKQTEKEFFLSLIFSTGEVRCILFEKSGESLLILGTHKKEFQDSLDSLSAETLIELSDEVISEVEKVLPEGSALEKTIFAIPDRWVVEGKIVKESLAKLKSLCDALHLVPVGFIVSVEAIVAYLHKKEGVPLTAIVVEVGKKHVTMSLVKNGNILLTSEKEIEDEPVKAVEALLSSQEELEVLPSKIILLNYEHAKKTQQSFLGHSWHKGLQFLHIPQVEVLDREIESQAVISGVATQMGFNILPEITIRQAEKSEVPVEVAVDEKVQYEDKMEQKNEDKESEDKHIDLEFKGETVGFFKGVDVLKKPKEEPVEVNMQETEDNPKEFERDDSDEKKGGASLVSLPNFPKPHLPSISFGLPYLSGPRGKLTFFYPILAVLLFIGFVAGYYYLFEQAEAVIYLDKKGINKELNVTFLPEKPTSSTESTVNVEVISVATDGKEEQSTTGKKETGDKAKGELTLYNKTESPKTFEKGTIIVGANNLEFNLTDDVKVASTSSFSTSFSSAKGKVEAAKFGKEYNLPSGSNFQLKGQSTSSYFAKNDSAFSGGTKKEVTVVSRDDISSLQSKIISTLSKKALNDARGKVGVDAQVLTPPIEYSFDEKTYSKKEGDEANTVSLTATITYKMGAYKKSDLINLAKEVTASEAPSDYAYSGKDSEIQVKDVEENDGILSGKLVFSSVFLPNISSETIKDKIIGKSVLKAEEFITRPGIADQKITFTRSLPLFPQILPFNKKNISIVIKSQ